MGHRLLSWPILLQVSKDLGENTGRKEREKREEKRERKENKTSKFLLKISDGMLPTRLF